jgi:hypothetical protein
MKLFAWIYAFLVWFEPASLAGLPWWVGALLITIAVSAALFWPWVWILIIGYAVLSALAFLATRMPGPQ